MIYHTRSGIPGLEVAGDIRYLACLPPKDYCNVPRFSAAYDTLPEAKWRECDYSFFKAPVTDQKSTNSCVGQSTATCFKRSWQMAGQEYLDFSPYWVYALINGGRDNGAQIEDAVTAVQKYGVATADEIPRGVLFPNQLPKSAFDRAKNRRALDVHLLQSFEDLCTALSLGFCCVSGIPVSQRWMTPDADGVCPLVDTVVGYHALEHHGLVFSPKRQEWLVLTQNSYGNSWGINGCCKLRKQHFTGRMHAFAIRAVYDDPTVS